MLKMQQICIKLKVTVAMSKTDYVYLNLHKMLRTKIKLFAKISWF